tara:strand:- start:2834 stop:3523 length:690 start_codon:yes stop_codon:yes gene_type:complete
MEILKINKLSMYRLFYISLYLLIVVTGNSQLSNELNFRFLPASLVDPFNRSLSYGFEYTINPERSFITDISFMFSVLDENTGLGHSANGLGLKAEYRYYLQDRLKTSHSTFLGIRGQLAFRDFDVEYKFARADSNLVFDDYYEDSVGVLKTSAGINMVLGYEYQHKRYAFQIFTGIGIKYINVQQSGRINKEDKHYHPHPDWPIYYWVNRPGDRISLNIPLCCSISYRI